MSDKETQKREHADRLARGADASMSERPGVPMEVPPEPLTGVHWSEPEQQKRVRGVTHRRELSGLTRVFSSAARPRLLSGLLRRLAYRIPETKARHWITLLFADRVDVFERRLGGALKLAAFAGVIVLGARVLRRG